MVKFYVNDMIKHYSYLFSIFGKICNCTFQTSIFFSDNQRENIMFFFFFLLVIYIFFNSNFYAEFDRMNGFDALVLLMKNSSVPYDSKYEMIHNKENMVLMHKMNGVVTLVWPVFLWKVIKDHYYVS